MSIHHESVAPPALAASDLGDLLLDAGATVLDVRTPGEFGAAHIPGSHNAPLDLLSEHAPDILAAAGGPVVLVCRSGARARQAEERLRAAGLPRLHVLDGGLAAWEAAGLPVARGRSRWSMERQVRGVAGALALSGALGGLFLWRPLGGLAAGIGGGLLVSALTDSCIMARLLAALPYNQHGATGDVADLVHVLSGATEPASPLAAD